MPSLHDPVMSSEALEYLSLTPGMRVLDCTVGCGGHARAALQKILPGGFLLGLDLDNEAIEEARKNLEDFKGSFKLICDNFGNLPEILKNSNVKKFDACLMDLGLSSLQLENSERGFSIRYDGPLDMRMDRSNPINASDIVNKFSEQELARILKEFGEERFSRSIARRIVYKRRSRPISSTWELAGAVSGAIPARYSSPRRKKGRIHPATRTFQALRIAVNGELRNLVSILEVFPKYIKANGRICVISFHSLEDRLVKRAFKKLSAENVIRILTKKPLRPTDGETASNPRARSAKLRAAQKI